MNRLSYGLKLPMLSIECKAAQSSTISSSSERTAGSETVCQRFYFFSRVEQGKRATREDSLSSTKAGPGGPTNRAELQEQLPNS